MNFSSSLMTGMGISLGGLELATDYLFANSDLYEPELTEIKTTISKKPQSTVIKKIKPVKPKVTRENIISKFSIIQDKPTIISDIVISSVEVIKEDNDFDFSFDDNDDVASNEIVDDNSEYSSTLEANLLMQRLNGLSMNNDNTLNFESESIDIEEDEFGLDEDSFDLEDDDQFIEEDDTEEYNDINDEDDIDNMDFDEDSFDLEDDSSDSNTDSNIDNIDTDEDNYESDDFIDLDSDEDDIDTIDLDESDESEEDNFDFEEDNDEDDDIDLEDSLDDIEIEDDEEEDSSYISESTNIIEKKAESNSPQSIVQTDNREIEQLKSQIASLSNELQKINSSNTSKDTSAIKNINNKSDDLDDLNNLLGENKTKTNKVVDRYERYNIMTTDQLYKHVRQFMIKMGVDRRPVDISALNNEFGERNIKTLIHKSYLIKIGKGATTGR